jgi:CO dehydrogenase nickel-insertion accessory protein CooC1
MGGKGGTGKTAFTTALVDWYGARTGVPALIDMDTENKAHGSLAHFFSQARKSNIQQASGLDDFVNVLDEGQPIVVADMGSGAGAAAHAWFDAMYDQAAESGLFSQQSA